MSEAVEVDRVEVKARRRALQQRYRRPVTELGISMNMKLTIARMTIQDLDRKAKSTIWEAEISDYTALLLNTLRDIEQVIMEWELSQ